MNFYNTNVPTELCCGVFQKCTVVFKLRWYQKMVLRTLTVKVCIDTLAQVYDLDNRINVISF